MRQRLRPFRPRSMARRPAGDDDRFRLSPRALRIAGWLAALLLVLGIAFGVRLLGGNADGAPSPGSSMPADLPPITFGTGLDAATGQVAEAARTDRFAAGDTFAYSVSLADALPEAVYVEVRRTGGGTAGVVQEPIDAQRLPNPQTIAFRVPADDLLAVFGPGEYLMLIYAEPAGEPIAEGMFELVGPDIGPSSSP